jgi:hypothetical protein
VLLSSKHHAISLFSLLNPSAPRLQVGNETSATALLEKDYLHDIILEYKQLTGDAYCELRWSSPSVPKQIIASANLYVMTHIRGSPFMNVTIGGGDPPYFDVR